MIVFLILLLLSIFLGGIFFLLSYLGITITGIKRKIIVTYLLIIFSFGLYLLFQSGSTVNKNSNIDNIETSYSSKTKNEALVFPIFSNSYDKNILLARRLLLLLVIIALVKILKSFIDDNGSNKANKNKPSKENGGDTNGRDSRRL